MTSFRADILDSSLIKNPENELHDLCDQYTSVLTSLLDKHAPLQTKKIVEKAPTPWMTSKLLDCKRSCRQLKKRWRRSRSGYDTINNILHRTPAAALPESNNVKPLCEHFAKIFL